MRQRCPQTAAAATPPPRVDASTSLPPARRRGYLLGMPTPLSPPALGGLAFLAGLTDLQLGRLADVGERVTADGDTLLFTEGDPRRFLFLVASGSVAIEQTLGGRSVRLATFGAGDAVGEGVLLDEEVHGTGARTLKRTELVRFPVERLEALLGEDPALYAALVSRAAKVVARRLRSADATLVGRGRSLGFGSGRVRVEHDLLGEREVPEDALYGVQTLRALENFPITGVPVREYPALIEALASVKEAAARANAELGLLPQERSDAICRAARETSAA